VAGSPPQADIVVVGSGPNGLAAAIETARAGFAVVVIEGADAVGGGARSSELTLPGFVHDVCSAIHPLGLGSPFFATLPLDRHGLFWVQPEAPLAHPLDDGTAVVVERSVGATARTLGRDAEAYERLMAPLAADWPALAEDVLGPPRLPRRPAALARFAARALRSARGLADGLFRGVRARALFAGLSAHSFLPLSRPPSAAFGLVLGLLAHAVGWPMPRGGAQRLSDALASCLRDLGGRIVTGRWVGSLDELPPARAILLDVTPRQLLSLAGDRLGRLSRWRLSRYRYGPGVFKVDWALDGPIPWRAAECLRAGTVHVGGTLEEIAAAEEAVRRGLHPERPFVLVAQQSLFDPSRAPAGRHTGWAYCHVPNGSRTDMTGRIEDQVERFAPGFRERILARHVMNAAAFESYNPNCVGGDINGGAADLRQIVARPVLRPVPYATGIRGVYLCSAATPPGGGVHGMCGCHAARTALRALRRRGPFTP
jgi:phytoene dehydrogenase-like protein